MSNSAENENDDNDDARQRCCGSDKERPRTCRSRCPCGSHIQNESNDPQDRCLWWWLNSWLALLCDGLCLVGFVLVLLPGFVRFIWFYSVTATNRHFVRYGTVSCRQSLDVYTVVKDRDTDDINDSRSTRRRNIFLCKRQATEESSTSDEDDNSNTEPLLSRQSSAAERGAPSAPQANNHDPVSSSNNDTVHSPEERRRYPVVLFFPGGAWMIGYKMWAALTARVLSTFGIVTVVCDYRNHPFGTIPDMVQDVNQALQWTVDHIAEYGGDPTRITVVGQSAGGHLVTTAVLKRAKELQERASSPEQKETSQDNVISWRPCDLAGLISVSAPYHFPTMSNTFRQHGLSSRTLDTMFANGQYDRDDYDPLRLVRRELQEPQEQDPAGLAKHLPPRFHVWHGSRDATVPWQSAEAFSHAMEELCAAAEERRPEFEFRLYPSWTHTDAILEGPMSGCHEFHKDLFQQVVHGDEACEWNDDHFVLQPMWCPTVLAELGRFFIPF